MTDDPQAGPELDALIAEKVMGLNVLGMANVKPDDECCSLLITLNETDEQRPVALDSDPEFACVCDRSNPLAIVLGHNFLCRALTLVPEYSTDPAAALAVVERLAKSGWSVQWNGPPFSRGPHDVRFSYFGDDPTVHDRGSAEANTLPLAICRAALRAVEQQP